MVFNRFAVEDGIVWIDTRALQTQPRIVNAETSRPSYENPGTANVAASFVRLLVRRVDPQEVGYIAPFKAQARLFKDVLRK